MMVFGKVVKIINNIPEVINKILPKPANNKSLLRSFSEGFVNLPLRKNSLKRSKSNFFENKKMNRDTQSPLKDPEYEKLLQNMNGEALDKEHNFWMQKRNPEDGRVVENKDEISYKFNMVTKQRAKRDLQKKRVEFDRKEQEVIILPPWEHGFDNFDEL